MTRRSSDARLDAESPSGNLQKGGDSAAEATTAARPALEVQGVSKWYGATHALDDVSLQIPRGHVHGLLGANGAGKSTLVEIIAGALHGDSGGLKVEGRDYRPIDVQDAERHGVVTIHQTLHMPPAMPVYEYLHLGRSIPRRWGALVDWHRMRREAEGVAERVGLADQLDTATGHLHPAHRRMLAIGRALKVHNPRVLLLDEPTAELDRSSVSTLMTLIKGAAAHDTAVIFVSHRLDEVVALCETCTVLRNGTVAFDGDLKTTSEAELIDLIAVSRQDAAGGTQAAAEVTEKSETRPRTTPRRPEAEPPAVQLDGVTTETLRELSLEVQKGEVVGLAGLAGAGRSSVCRVIFGLERRRAGAVSVGGKKLRRPRIGRLMREGAFFVPEDRSDGLFTTFTLEENTSLANLRNIVVPGTGVLNPGRERAISRRIVSEWEVYPPEPGRRVAALSGGNQQKVAIGKWLADEARVLVLDEPAAGIDVGTKAAVFGLLRRLAERGCAILMTSSDPNDLVSVCNRVAVLREGSIAKVLIGPQECTEEAIVRASMGEEAEQG